MAWIYLQEKEVTQRPLKNGLHQSLIVSESDTLRPNYSRECQKVNSLSRRSGTTLQHSLVGSYLPSPISSMEDSHVKISVLRELVKAWVETEAAYFSRSRGWPKKSDPSLYSLKTSLQSEHEDSEKLQVNWPASGMIVDGLLYPLERLELPICESAGFALPTPTVRDSAEKPMPPRRKTTKESGKIMGGQKPPLLSVVGGALNPRWVEWLMGVPLGWTKLNNLGMAWFLSRHEPRSKYFQERTKLLPHEQLDEMFELYLGYRDE